jgi:hypothetical protein
MLRFVFMLVCVAHATELINENSMEYFVLLNAINETEQNLTYFNMSDHNITYPSCLYGDCPANTTNYTLTIPVPCPLYFTTNIEGADNIHDCMWDSSFNQTVSIDNNTSQRRAEKVEAVQVGFMATVGAVAGTSAVVAGVVVGLQAAGVIPSTFLSSLGGLIVARKLEAPKPQRPNMFRNIKIEPIHFSKPHGPGLSRGR